MRPPRFPAVVAGSRRASPQNLGPRPYQGSNECSGRRCLVVDLRLDAPLVTVEDHFAPLSYAPDHAPVSDQEARTSPRVPTTVEIAVVISDASALPCG